MHVGQCWQPPVQRRPAGVAPGQNSVGIALQRSIRDYRSTATWGPNYNRQPAVKVGFRKLPRIARFVSKSTRYLFFDTETSGLPRQMDAPVARLNNWPRVIQLAWILTDFQGQILSQQQYLVQPTGWRMQPGAFKVHGISLQRAREVGLPLTSVLERFNLDLLQTDSIVGHNVQFDQKILGAEFLRIGQTNPLQRRHAQCTMKIGASFLSQYSTLQQYSIEQGDALAEPSGEYAHTVSPRTSHQAAAIAQATRTSHAALPPRSDANLADPEWPVLDSSIESRGGQAAERVDSGPVQGATWRDPKRGFRYPSLRRLYRTLFGRDFSHAHDALADTQACMKCFFRMARS